MTECKNRGRAMEDGETVKMHRVDIHDTELKVSLGTSKNNKSEIDPALALVADTRPPAP